MAYSKIDLERLRNYEIVFNETSKLIDNRLKTSQTITEYILQFTDILEDCISSKDINTKFIGWVTLNVVFPKFVYFLFMCESELPCVRNCFDNLILVMFQIAINNQSKIHRDILDEMELVLLPALGDKTVKQANCLEHDKVQNIIDDWNIIKNPVEFIRKYAHKFEIELENDGSDWNDIYGFCVTIYMYLTLYIPNDMIFVDRNTEYMIFSLIIEFHNHPVRIHPHFLKIIKKKLKLLRPYQI